MKKKHWRVYSDQQGESHVEERDVDLQLMNYAPPAPPVFVSSPTAAAGFVFLCAPKGIEGDLHPTPRRQLQVLLSGSVELEASDGTVVTAKPGDVFLLEDTQGRGHKSRIGADQAAEILAVTMP
jgi:hypothetical protein